MEQKQDMVWYCGLETQDLNLGCSSGLTGRVDVIPAHRDQCQEVLGSFLLILMSFCSLYVLHRSTLNNVHP